MMTDNLSGLPLIFFVILYLNILIFIGPLFFLLIAFLLNSQPKLSIALPLYFEIEKF